MKGGSSLFKIICGSGLLAVVVILVIAAPIFTEYAPDAANAQDRLMSFSRQHLFGADRFGRDIFTRTLYGGRTTLVSSFAALGMALTIGVSLGIITGLRNRTLLDAVLMRIIDVLMSFPFMVFAMVVAGLWGNGLMSLLIAVVVVWWVPFARLSRSIVLQQKQETSVAAAEVLGASSFRIVFCELLPKTMGPIFVLATFELGTLILSISALSFLGMGAQPPTPEWGSMLADARPYFFRYPHLLFGLALFVVLTVFSLNLIGEGLRDYLDPYEGVKL